MPATRSFRPLPVFSALSLPLFAAALLVSAVRAQPAVDLPRQSPAASVSQTFGFTTVEVRYSRPAVNARVIWGSLVPYGRVWRAGANEPNVVTFSTAVRVNGRELPAGAYALFVLPEKRAGKEQWTFIFSRNTKTWGAFGYDAKDDALRIPVIPEQSPHQERLEFAFEKVSDTNATLALHWEKLRGILVLEADFLEQGKANIAKGLPNAKPDDPYSWMNAARFYWTHDIDRKQAMEWIDRSIAVKPMFGNLWVKAGWLAEQGNYAEALAVGRLARADAAKDPNVASQLPEIDKQLRAWGKKK